MIICARNSPHSWKACPTTRKATGQVAAPTNNGSQDEHREAWLSDEFDIEAIFRRHADTVYRVCLTRLRVPADAEDVTQQVFMRLVSQPRAFNDDEHVKAWLIACASNACKDTLKSPRRTRAASMPDDVVDTHVERDETLEAVLALKDPPRTCVYLHYYEGYSSAEIGEMIGANASTVRNWLAEARKELRTVLGGDGHERR